MNILISGAGPVGLTAAYWLRRYGFSSTIVERAPSLSVGGYKIDVRGAALQVLRQTEVHDAVVAAQTDMQGALLVDKNGNVVNRMSGDDFGHRIGGDVETVRGTLCQILKDRLADVELLFSADGLHSNIRRIVFGEESRFLRDLGLYLCVYCVPNYLQLDRMEIQYSELGRIAAIWSSRGDTVERIDQSSDSTRVQLAKNGVREFDLVIGDEVRRKEVARRLAAKAADAGGSRPHDGVDYQSLHATDRQGS